MADPGTLAPLEPPTCDDRAIWDVWMAAGHFPALIVADEIGLFPFLAASPATAEEVARAARQYVRKVAAVSTAGQMASPAIERAIERIAAAATELLAELPARRNPPSVVPPLRRRG